jgi:5'-3' exonuclease
VDDFVLLTVLCGNDFIPHLPSLDIGEGALDLLLQYYREHLPSLGGYLVEEGVINFDRLEALTTFMGSLEQATLAKREADARRFARRGGGRWVIAFLCVRWLCCTRDC